MNRTTIILTSLAAALLGSAALLTAGPLSPPAGPVASSYKTLSDVEPRIPLSASTTPGDATSKFRITTRGSYYLTGNLQGESGKNGIVIAADGVTLDLSGFVLTGTAGTLNGILVSPGTGITVRNGHVTGWAGDGVNAGGNGLMLENISSDNNLGWGINFLTQYPGNTVSRCSAGSNALGGINAPQATLVSECIVYVNSGPGIAASNGSRVEHCSIWNCNPGISLAGSNAPTAVDNTFFGCAVGISCSSTDARVERNHIRVPTGNVGLRATAAGNSFVDNVVTGQGDKYDFVPGNRLELVIAQLPESIDWSAHVKLQGSLIGTSGSAGITVNADDVTIDLGGFAMTGVAGTGNGIQVLNNRRNTVVTNGTVAGWGGTGVELSSGVSAEVSGVHATDNGAAGIIVGANGVVRNCTATSNVNDNIRLNLSGRAERCVANSSTTANGINAAFTQCTVQDCTANANAVSGIRISQRGLVTRCTASDNVVNGVHITFVGTVEDCYLQSNDAVGILMDSGGGAIIRRNHVSESPTGIRIVNAGVCRVQDNTVLVATTGYLISSSGNLVQGNACAGAATPYNIAAGNTAGPIVTSATIATATNPFANVTY